MKEKKMIENDFGEKNKIIRVNFIKKVYFYSFFQKYINEILEDLYNKFISIFLKDENHYNDDSTFRYPR
jgi:hypothetical protein